MFQMYDPATFQQPYSQKVFCSIVYYMVLRHKVSYKVKARGRSGRRHPLTGQAIHARKKNGGIRVGEMEVVQLLAQGADEVVHELFDNADRIEATYCL